MSIQLLDRLQGAIREARGGTALLARYLVPLDPGRELFVNSIAVADGTFLVPDSGGRWQLLSGDSERFEGIFPRVQALDTLDASSILAVGQSVGDMVARGGTWLDAFDVSPLVPGISKRAEMQPLDTLMLSYVGHLQEVCRRPRAHLKIEVERMAVSRARRFPAQAGNYLAAHTEDWERPTLRAVVPKRILAVVREDQYDIYENRVAVRLVDHLIAYLRDRVREVSKLLRVFEDLGDHSSSAAGGSHWRQGRIYRLWGSAIDAGEARRKAERTLRQLNRLKYILDGLMDSVLYREIPRRAAVSATLTMTNILSNDLHYRRIADLWLAWARLGLDKIPRPREYFEEMQALCRSFDRYSLLLAIRALDQMGFEPVTLDRPLADGEAKLCRGESTTILSWSSADGVITLRGNDISSLRIVPLSSSIAMLEPEDLLQLMNEVDEGAASNSVTVVLYPTPSSSATYEHMEPELARRLHALSHEVADDGRRLVGFLPVSPWDIASVERVAREIRWVTVAPRFLAYPPTIDLPPLPELAVGASWLEVAGNKLHVVRLPYEHEMLATGRYVADAEDRLEKLQTEHESVSQQLRDAHRDRRATGELNSRKKALNADVTSTRARLSTLLRFQAELTSALASVNSILRCPTCGKQADPRRDFEGGPGHRFSCTCSECSTTWGTVACPSCHGWIPTLLPASRSWIGQSRGPGWLDKFLGADVLAAPCVVGGEVGFVCQSCGHPNHERVRLSPR